jgi:hypothetical protein
LEYKVTNGLYQGTQKAIGFDGLWLSPEGHSIIVEIKTTDVYRVPLDTIAGYRDKLRAGQQIMGPSSILIIVGRQDTGELEAQIRGSRHAWDIRLISADALIKLVQLKENTEGSELRIRSLLVPMEYTRLDPMIDVMFATAKDVEEVAVAESNDSDEPPEAEAPSEKVKGIWEFTDSRLLQQKRDQIVAALGHRTGTTFIKRSRALFWDANHSERLVCTLSKRYTKKGKSPYWFAYHPQWHTFLREGKESCLVLGCMDLSFAFAIPVDVVSSVLDALHTTTKHDGQVYSHIHVAKTDDDRYTMLLPKKSGVLPLDDFRVTLA